MILTFINSSTGSDRVQKLFVSLYFDQFWSIKVIFIQLVTYHVSERMFVQARISLKPLSNYFKFAGDLGTVYTDAVSFVTASVSMRLRLSFTRRRSSSLSEPCRFEYAFKSGAFSKRYGSEVV